VTIVIAKAALYAVIATCNRGCRKPGANVLKSTSDQPDKPDQDNELSTVTGKALNPTVFKLGLVSLFADISTEMLYPITPVFLTTVLGASMASVGLIEGIAEAIASLLKAYSGVWSDRITRRKPFVAAGYLLAALAKPLTGAAGNWTHVLFARGLDRTGKGIRSAPRDALLADAVTTQSRGEAFGWHRGMDTLGAAIGPLIAIYFLAHHSERDLRPLYFWALIPGLLAVALVLLVKENSTRVRPLATPKAAQPLFLYSSLSPTFRKYLLAWGVFSLANSSDVFLLMRVQQNGIALNWTIGLYCFYNLFYAVLSPYLGRLSDQWGRRGILLTGLIIFAVVYLGFSVATEFWQFAVLFAVYGFYMAATDGVGKAYAVDLISPNLKATAIGALAAVTGLATVVASTVAGLIWDHYGSQWTFLYGAIGAIVGASLLKLL
jgi:MFS family permease